MAVGGVIDTVVAPVDHEYVYGAVPPLGLAVSVADAFAHTAVGPLMVAVGFALTVRICETALLQYWSLTVTL